MEVIVMKKRNSGLILAGVLVIGFSLTSVLAEQEVFGSQLMTQQERMEHRTKMQNMKTKEERERYRMEHHKKMQERAKQQGVTLPDKPRMRNHGMGEGRGMGGGQGGGKGR